MVGDDGPACAAGASTAQGNPESGWSRLTTGGCPFWNRDLDWAGDSLVAQISDSLRAVAAGRGLEFLGLRDTLQSREVCATAASLSDGAPSPTTSVWTRFLVSGVGQGDLQESFHPNAYAERGLGRCPCSGPRRPGASRVAIRPGSPTRR